MFDVVALGECLIDCTPAGKNEMGMSLFACNPGGAPANVLAMNAKLGGQTAFIGKVGKDSFGAFLKETMQTAGIDTSGLYMSEEYKTTLAFVQLDDKGERSFSFYRKPGADVMLTSSEVNTSLLMNCKIFHFGSVSLTDEPCRSTTLHAVQIAKDSGALISYDPNYRPALWQSADEAKVVIAQAVPLSHVLKVSDEEMTLLTGKTECEVGARQLSQMGPPIVFITMGEKGSYFYTPSGQGFVPALPMQAVDTTGAGDAFLGALHHSIQKKPLQELIHMPAEEWQAVVCFASAAGGLTVTKKGAIPAMPSREEIEALL